MTAASNILPDAEWRTRGGLIAVVDALRTDSGGCRYVGGAVRDTLLGHAVSDVDLATPLMPEKVMSLLEQAKIKVIPTGIDHGTVTAVTSDGPIEITTLRKDVSTDGRRATIAYSDDWREDAARRDFTVNALYADPDTGEIIDYFGGLDDLKNGCVRFIGKAEERIAEDHLRIMRYFRFLARFGDNKPDDEAYAACRTAANSLMALSRERIADELLKLLALANPEHSIKLMVEGSIFAAIIPEISTDSLQQLSRLVKRELNHEVEPLALRRLLALLPFDTKLVDNVATRLKFSKKMRSSLADRLKNDAPNAKNIRALAYRHGWEAARDSALLHSDETQLSATLKRLESWQAPRLPIKGGALVQRGVKPGPDVARLLSEIEQIWIDEEFASDERVNEIANQAASDFLASHKKL